MASKWFGRCRKVDRMIGKASTMQVPRSIEGLDGNVSLMRVMRDNDQLRISMISGSLVTPWGGAGRRRSGPQGPVGRGRHR